MTKITVFSDFYFPALFLLFIVISAKMEIVKNIILVGLFTAIGVGGANNTREKILIRKKRYLVFPEGSSLSIAICMTAQTGITPGELFTEGINWGITYELPNDTKPFKELLNKPKELMQRRHRRDLYTKIETIMKSMGYDGRNCILRALCEASRTFKPGGESLMDEILRIVFRYPKYDNGRDEDEFHPYRMATHKGMVQTNEECSEMFPGCAFSLIDLALGYYSAFGYYPDS